MRVGSCTAGFQWRQPPGTVPTLVLVERTTPSNRPVALKCVAAASIRTCFRVPRCALVAKLNRAHRLPGTVSILFSWNDVRPKLVSGILSGTLTI